MSIVFITNEQIPLEQFSQNSSTYYYQTPIGPLTLTVTANGIISAWYEDTIHQMREYITDAQPIIVSGTAFQMRVWKELLTIPAGSVVTYQDIARAIGKPKASRAVANALANNKIAYFIPCHRVVRKDGSLGGYKWGIEKKKALLKSEGSCHLFKSDT